MERVQTTIRLPGELMAKLQREAVRRGISVNDEITRRIRWSFESESAHAPLRIEKHIG